MNETRLKELLQQLLAGSVSADEVVGQIKQLPFEDVPAARIDHHRSLRCGFSEVIFCAGKTDQQVGEIFMKLAATGENVLATRATPEMYREVLKNNPVAEFNELAGAISLKQKMDEPIGHVAIVAAGTSDFPIAEEARITAETMGAKVTTHYDVGVAGLHRLLAECPEIREARAVVAVAGMEGALASVVGGLVASPVIGVPTSIGYGANFGGLSALLSMLNSCASGVSVVNIDNGFAGGYNAAVINMVAERAAREKEENQ